MSGRLVVWEVDAQKDFMLPGVKLYVRGAEKLIPNIRRLVQACESSSTLLISSACAHTENDPEFPAFPPNCINGTDGRQTIPEGMKKGFAIIPNDPSYKLPA